MNDKAVIFWFLIASGTLSGLVALFLKPVASAFFNERNAPSETAITFERLLAALISVVAFTIAARGQY